MRGTPPVAWVINFYQPTTNRFPVFSDYVRVMSGPNAIAPDQMTAEERIAELGQLLALGHMRLQARKSSRLSADRGDSFVDFLPDQSGHADAPKRRTA